MTETDFSSIQTRRHGATIHITLNEPGSLNALAPAMVDALHQKLLGGRDDASIGWIVMDGAGGKAFCAGADVRAMWRHASAGQYSSIECYFSREYDVDLLLAQYPKPVIALVDGICFGGGMGLAVHSTYCVATEAASFSMPETLIGFFPDAGATWFLSRLPGALGLYLGLTGARVSGPDAVRLGLASNFVPRAHFAAVSAEIAEHGPAKLKDLDFPLPPSALEEIRPQIDRCFGAGSLKEIFARLAEDQSSWSRQTAEVLSSRSPASLAWTFESLRNPGDTLADCLENERRLVAISTRHPDFQEGIRAALIDKDKTPRWQPAN
ncbi:enoyl-CoA hydratase/isomerase family protein [Mesorhizobium sp. ASY16-5R]|uniref:enoyl-CoA hydratase/isomerase family protein n=1 Tax=Mesorhizobium sp. ASY16-5R TaxID=3445772 RepID=UPI003F9FD2C4